MSQSLSKIGVQFIADMSDMVQKMNGMSAFTKNWAEKLATSMFSATPEQKQFSFVTNLRQSEINSRNEREQREREMAALKQRLEKETAQQQRELNARLVAEEKQATDNMINEEEIKRIKLAAFKKRLQEEVAAEEERIVKNAIDNAAQHWINSYNQQQKMKREAALKEKIDAQNALSREVRIARLRNEAFRAVGTGSFSLPSGPTQQTYTDQYEEDRAKRQQEKEEEIAQAERVKANRLAENKRNQDEANRLLERYERNILASRNATQRYNDELSRLNWLLDHNNQETGKAYLTSSEFKRLKTALILETVRQQQAERRLTQSVRETQNVVNQSQRSYSELTGVMTQLSFATEDFIQGVAFGDFRNALLGASNNLTQVARGLFSIGAQAGMLSSVFTPLTAALIAIPAGIIAGVQVARWVNGAARDARSLADAIRDATFGLESFSRAAAAASSQRAFDQRLEGMKSTAQVESEMEAVTNRRLDAEREIENIRRRGAIVGEEVIRNAMGGAEAVAEIEQYIAYTRRVGSQQEKEAAAAVEKSLSAAREAAREGRSETVINELRTLFELLNSNALVNGTEWLSDPAALNALEEIFQTGYVFAGESQERLREIRETLANTNNDLSEAQIKQLQAEEQMLQLMERHKQLQQEEQDALALKERNKAGELKAEQDKLEAKREELMLMMKMTEEQRKMYDLRQRQLEFVGYDPAALGVGAGFAGIAGAAANAAMQQQADQLGMQFLLAEQAKLQKEMVDAVQQPPVAAKMEQNAFQAQADALKQITEAQNRKQDTRQEAMVRHLADISRAIQNGGIIAQVVP